MGERARAQGQLCCSQVFCLALSMIIALKIYCRLQIAQFHNEDDSKVTGVGRRGQISHFQPCTIMEGMARYISRLFHFCLKPNILVI